MSEHDNSERPSEAMRKLQHRRRNDQPDGDADRYEVLNELGRGGVGVVYRGRDIDLGREVAMKVLNPQFADHAEVLDRFVEEAQIGGQLQHPGIVPVYEIGLQHDERPFIAMKLVKGETLYDQLKRREFLDEDRQRFVAAFHQICLTMAYAHARHVVHRDLKPANVMIGSFGEVQVVDWGFAKVLSEERSSKPPQSVIETVRSQDDSGSKSMLGSVLGTPAYMPREQALGDTEHMDQRSDVFGLGGVLCEILTGTPVYLGSSEEALLMAARGDLAATYERLDRCQANATLIELCKQCLQDDATKRPADAQVVADEIAQFLASVEQRARDAEVKAAEARVRARATMLLSAAALLILVLGGGGYYYLERTAAERTARATSRAADARAAADVEFGKARAANVDDAAPWQLAAAAAEQARKIAIDDDVTADERQRIEQIAQRIERASHDAAQVREQRRRDRQLRDDLAAVFANVEAPRSTRSLVDRQRERDAKYRSLFAAYLSGRAIDDLSATEAADALRESAIVSELAASLDDWAYSRSDLQEAAKSEGPPTDVGKGSAHLRAIARALQPDNPLRTELGAMLEKREYDTARLQAIADESDWATLSPTDLNLLSAAMWEGNAAEAAIATLQRGIDHHPQEYVLHSALAGRLSELPEPRYAEAMAATRAMMAIRPTPHGAVTIALCKLGLFQDDEAIADLERLTTAYPEWDVAWNQLGLARMHAYQLEEAQRCFEKAIEIVGPRADYLSNLGSLFGAAGDAARSETFYREAVELEPKHAKSRANLANALRHLGRYEEAITVGGEALKLDPRQFTAHVNIACSHQARGEIEQAQQAFDRALEIAPNNSIALTNYGVFLRSRGQLAEALDCYRRALEHDPTHPEIHANYALLLSDTGKPAEALAHLAEHTPKVRAHITLLQTKAHCELALGRPLDGIQTLEAAAAKWPEDPAPFVELGRIHGSMGKHEQARDALLKGLELGDKGAELHSNLATCYGALGERKLSLKHARLAVKAAPNHGPSHFNLGMALARSMNLKGAVDELFRAREIWSNDGTTFGRRWYGISSQQLGQMLMALRRPDEAKQLLRESIEQLPRDVDLREILANILNKEDDDFGALRQYLAILELDADRAPVWMNVAGMHANSGKAKRAQQAAYRAEELFATQDTSFAKMWRGRAKKFAASLQTYIEECEGRLGIARGEQPAADQAEATQAATAAYALGDYALATAAWQRTFERWPELIDDYTSPYSAACAAALATVADDLSPSARTKRRSFALRCVRRATTTACTAPATNEEQRAAIVKRLNDLLHDPDLDDVRSEEAIARMPVEEAAEWRKQWQTITTQRARFAEQK